MVNGIIDIYPNFRYVSSKGQRTSDGGGIRADWLNA
jgi:hypothetical protein